MDWKTDCRHFIGEKPCRFKRICEGCGHYDPFDIRILIIKMAAIGDVMRTTPLLKPLKLLHPRSQITWLTEPGGFEMLKGIESIDRLLKADLGNVTALVAEHFDMLFCLDKDPLSTGLAMTIKAENKFGFGRDKTGALIPLNNGSKYAYNLGLDDDLKFRDNRKTYPQIIFEAAEIQYNGEEYEFVPAEEDMAYAENFANKHGITKDDLIIGLNTGCGPVFQMKKWPIENTVEFINILGRKLKPKILLYGGPLEKERNREIMESAEYPVIDTGCENSLRQFTGLVNLSDILVTTDTMAMHVGIALKKPLLLLIGSTSWTEIDLFGRGEKIITDMDCAPCYKKTCDFNPWCMQGIKPERVFEALRKYLPKANKQ